MKQASPILLGMLFLAGLVLPEGPVQADQFHYNNFLIGDRAIGLAGAYGGVSDDASGIYYNPAGLGFALSNDISGSANAYYSKTVTYKKAVGNEDFQEKSGGTVPSFFGGLQKLDSIKKGLVLGFGMYTTDSELKDQDTLITNVTLSQQTDPIDGGHNCHAYVNGKRTSQLGGPLPMRVLQRYHRTSNERGSTFHAGGGMGLRVNNFLSVGLGVTYVLVDELTQEYQDVTTSGAVCKTNGSYAGTVQTLAQNVRQHVTGYGFQPVLGVQASLFGKFSLGLTVKFGSYLSQSLQQTSEQRQLTLLATDAAAAQTAGNKGQAYRTTGGFNEVYENAGVISLKNPLGPMTPEVRLGTAYFASTRLLVTFDLTYYAAVTGTDTLTGNIPLFSKSAVTNYAAGLEYYLIPAVPLRVGYFSNKDARPAVSSSSSNQRDHIDYNGETIFVAWVQPNSQIGAGVILEQGLGKAQKVSGNAVQSVDAQSKVFAFSATHSF